MLNFGRTPVYPLFIPDGSIDDGDRYHLLNLYSGIALSSVSPPIFAGNLSDLQVVTNTEKSVDYSGYFTDATSYSISPAVESGWSFNTSTGVLTILQSDVATYGPYTITGTNAGGSANSNEFYVQLIAGSTGGHYRQSRSLKPISEYEEEIKELLAREEEELLAEQKGLEKKEIKLEAKALLGAQQSKTRKVEETELNLRIVANDLAIVSANLQKIEKEKLNIKNKARILRDDDEIIMLLISEGYM